MTASHPAGQHRGSFPTPPAASALFPPTWEDAFDSSAVESVPTFWADQCGSFQIMPSGGGRRGNSILQRVSMKPGKNRWHGELLNPLTLLGNPLAATPTKVRVDVRVPVAAFPQPLPPPPPPPGKWHPPPPPPPSGAWVGLCGRVSQVGHDQNMGGVYNGVCLHINATAAAGGVSWRVVYETGAVDNGTQTLASGELHGNASAVSLSAWHTLELAFECGSQAVDDVGADDAASGVLAGGGGGGVDGGGGVGGGGGGLQHFVASIDGVVVGSGKTNTTAGMAALSSGWHVAEFDRFKLDAC